MANALYDAGREGFLDGSIDWDTNTIKCVFVDSADYTPNLGTDRMLSGVPSSGRIGTAQTITGKAVLSGIADGADVTFTSVSGDQFEYILIYQDTGNENTSRLIALIDSATGLPCTPNGGDITIQWDNTTNKIFKL